MVNNIDDSGSSIVKSVDPIFANDKLAKIYDVFEGERDDLLPYLKIIKEFKVKSILDIGCGTGSFACILAEGNYDVFAMDPAKASIDMALLKPNADKIKFFCCDMFGLPKISVDMAVMTANVAQVFIDDKEYTSTIRAIHDRLNPNAYLIFEVRDPEQKSWESWNYENTYSRRYVKDIGYVESFCEITEVKNDIVKFTWTYTFEKNGEIIKSDSTLKFRSKEDIINTLLDNGFEIEDIRDAPDRPGKEFVFIAKKVSFA